MIDRSLFHRSSPRRGTRRLLGISVAAATLVAAACGGSDDSGGSAASDGGKLTVVVTTTQLADFARQLGGDRVTVVSLAKPGADLHDFEPGPAELEDLRAADLVVRNGMGLDPWLDDALKAADADAEVIDASTGITPREATEAHAEDDHAGETKAGEKAGGEKADDHAHDHGEVDPHVWFDPRNAVQMVTTMADAFTAADSAGGATYSAALARYRTELEELDRDIETAVATLTNRKLVTNHDAFGYFVDRYGLQFVGSIIPSFDSTAELSAADVTELVARIKAEGVLAVFSEASIPPKTAEAIARDAGVKVVGGEDALYGDALGPAGSPGETYVGMMRHNARVIVEALGGTGPRG